MVVRVNPHDLPSTLQQSLPMHTYSTSGSNGLLFIPFDPINKLTNTHFIVKPFASAQTREQHLRL